jgi:hypothetical protein
LSNLIFTQNLKQLLFQNIKNINQHSSLFQQVRNIDPNQIERFLLNYFNQKSTSKTSNSPFIPSRSPNISISSHNPQSNPNSLSLPNRNSSTLQQSNISRPPYLNSSQFFDSSGQTQNQTFQINSYEQFKADLKTYSFFDPDTFFENDIQNLFRLFLKLQESCSIDDIYNLYSDHPSFDEVQNIIISRHQNINQLPSNPLLLSNLQFPPNDLVHSTQEQNVNHQIDTSNPSSSQVNFRNNQNIQLAQEPNRNIFDQKIRQLEQRDKEWFNNLQENKQALIRNLFHRNSDLKMILNIFQQLDSFYSIESGLQSLNQKVRNDIYQLEEQKKQDIQILFNQTSKLEMTFSLYLLNN